jgi:hypothetical protein
MSASSACLGNIAGCLVGVDIPDNCQIHRAGELTLADSQNVPRQTLRDLGRQGNSS